MKSGWTLGMSTVWATIRWAIIYDVMVDNCPVPHKTFASAAAFWANKRKLNIVFHYCRFEEGVRAQVNQELEELREQQKEFSDSLEELMEQNDIDDTAIEPEYVL